MITNGSLGYKSGKENSFTDKISCLCYEYSSQSLHGMTLSANVSST